MLSLWLEWKHHITAAIKRTDEEKETARPADCLDFHIEDENHRLAAVCILKHLLEAWLDLPPL